MTETHSELYYIERVDSMFSRSERDWSVDVLRCLSCFLVCAVHATNMTFIYGIECGGSNPWLHHETYRMLFASPTLLFVMISGIFFLSPDRRIPPGKIWRRNVFKMALAYVFWSLVYAFYRISLMDPRPEITFELVRNEWLVEHAHLWYIPMMLGLYIISPILRPITASYDRKLFRYFIFIFAGGLILWTIYNLPSIQADGSQAKLIIDKTPMKLICQYPMWMIFGWIAYTYRPSKRLRLIIYAAGLLSILAGIYVNTVIGVSAEDHWIVATTQKFSIFSAIKNVATFYFVLSVFRNHKFSRKGKFILNKWSQYTLIIYLVHYMILTIMYENDFLYDSGMSPWLGVWIYAAIAYFVGGMFALVFHLLWDPLNNNLFTVKRRSERIYNKLDKKRK